MTSEICSYTLKTLPPLNAKQRKNLNALPKKSDADIDLTDMPELTDGQLSEMRRPGDLYKPVKKLITARIDADCSRLARITRDSLSEPHQ